MNQNLALRIMFKEAKIDIIGLGYVGLPLAMRFSQAGFPVTGFDTDKNKVEKINKGESYISHIPSFQITRLLSLNQINSKNSTNPINSSDFTATTDMSQLKNTEAILICVPTPLNGNREPDLSYVINTTKTIAEYLRKGQLIVLESTTYPGTTEEEMLPILEENGLKVGKDFFLAYSPEREDPGNPKFISRDIPKVVGGVTSTCLELVKILYDQIVVKTVPVSSTRVAEATKLLENIYRAVNIALVNELKMLFDRMDIDIWEIINAAKTKPFGFTPFYPGPGLGGHCIPIDPFYLTWKAREFDFPTRFIELAGEINTSMPYYVVQKLIDALNQRDKTIKGAKVLILGVAYKRDVDDDRESTAYAIMDLLVKRRAKVSYHDPYIPYLKKSRRYNFGLKSEKLSEQLLKDMDAVVIVTDHSSYDYSWIVQHAPLVIDTRNAIKNLIKDTEKVIKA